MKLADGHILCSTCKVELTPENASPYNFRPENRQTHQCRGCQAARRRYCYRELPSVREYTRDYNREHPEYHKRWYAKNIDIMRKYQREYSRALYWADPEKARARSREAYRRKKARKAQGASA